MLLVLLASLAGAVVGSWVTVVAEDAGQSSLLRRRSRCASCARPLGALDLVPVVSFLALRGQCRWCGQAIPRWHLWTEIAAVGLFLVAGVLLRGQPLVALASVLVLLALLFALTVVDLRQFLLPDHLVAAVAFVGLARSLALSEPGLAGSLGGGVLGFTALGTLAILPWSKIRRPVRHSLGEVGSFRGGERSGGLSTNLRPAFAEATAGRQGFGGSPVHRADALDGPPMGLGDVKLAGATPLRLAFAEATAGRQGFGGSPARQLAGGPSMGLGDVKLAGAMGVTLGIQGLVTALFLAFVAGGAVGAFLLLTRRATLGTRVPFGPFLCGATAAVLLLPTLPFAFFRLLGFE